MMRVYPNPDVTVNGEPLKVRDPERGDFLPPEGRHVPRNTYWLRRKIAGDVIEGMPPAPSADPAPAEPADTAPQEITPKPDSAGDKPAKIPETGNEPQPSNDGAATVPGKRRGRGKKSEG